LQGTNERITNYYIRVIDAVNNIEALKKMDQQKLPENPWQEAAQVPQFMALAVGVRSKILALDYVSLNLFIFGLKPHIRKEVMRQTPKNLDNTFDMAVQSEKINYAPPKAAGATALPVMPIDQNNTPLPTEETEADLLAALEDIEADNENRVAAIKSKLSKFRRNGQPPGNRSSSNRSTNKSSSGARKPNPDKDVKCRYCNKMGLF